VYEVAEVFGKSRYERLSRSARSVFDQVTAFAREAAQNAPEKASGAAQLLRQASRELYEIGKEQAPVVAKGAIDSARTKLAVVLPFVKAKPNEESMPIAAE